MRLARFFGVPKPLKFRDAIQLRGDLFLEKFVHSDPSDPRSPLVKVGEFEAHNLFLNSGIAEMWKLIIGSSANTFTNAQAQIGIGDSSTAAAAGQTDLQAATNKTYKAMDATFPQQSGQTGVFKSTFGTADANYTWAEFVVKQGTSAICIDRGVSAMGTKTSAGTWVPTVTLTMA
jgi:uncharacterized cupin superfamily protein